MTLFDLPVINRIMPTFEPIDRCLDYMFIIFGLPKLLNITSIYRPIARLFRPLLSLFIGIKGWYSFMYRKFIHRSSHMFRVLLIIRVLPLLFLPFNFKLIEKIILGKPVAFLHFIYHQCRSFIAHVAWIEWMWLPKCLFLTRFRSVYFLGNLGTNLNILLPIRRCQHIWRSIMTFGWTKIEVADHLLDLYASSWWGLHFYLTIKIIFYYIYIK